MKHERTFDSVFGHGRVLIGVVHLGALPGAPLCDSNVAAIRDRALADARAYLVGGCDGLIVENFGDMPFYKSETPPHVVAAMAAIGSALKALAGKRPVGVNVLRNASLDALSVAVGAGLDFIRVNVLAGVYVTDQGVIEGAAAELLRLRRSLESDVLVLADLRVKHATPLRGNDLGIEVEELIGRALADAVLVTGSTTGRPPDGGFVDQVHAAAGGAPILVASGVDVRSVAAFGAARGYIVGTSLKRGGVVKAAVDPVRVKALRRAIDRLPAPSRRPTPSRRK